jgi:hypothetical protein
MREGRDMIILGSIPLHRSQVTVDKTARTDHFDSLVSGRCQKKFIAAHNVGRASRQRARKKFIVVRIAANSLLQRWTIEYTRVEGD